MLKNKTGFTLIELLLTTVILLMAGTLIAAALGKGFDVYKRLTVSATGEQEAVIALEKFERDVRNTGLFSNIKFTGDARRISFAGSINQRTAEGKKYLTPGRITYFLDDVDHGFMREEAGYAAATSEDGGMIAGQVTMILGGATDFSVSYFYYDPEKKEYKWRDSWGSEESEEEKKLPPLPLGVRVEVMFKSGGKEFHRQRTVFIPISGEPFQ